MRILKEIKEDIEKIRQIVEKETLSGHEMLKGLPSELESPLLLSCLLLTSAKFNQYSFDELEPAAVGLELLNLGVRKHYRKSDERSLRDSNIDNLSLVAGDYYYSRGILFASQLGKSLVVEIMARAIVEITEARAFLNKLDVPIDDLSERHDRSLLKQAGLCGAACELGALLGKLDSKMSGGLKKFGESTGVLHGIFEIENCFVKEPDVYKKIVNRLVERAKENLTGLPENKYRFFLAEFVEDLAQVGSHKYHK